MICCDWVIAAVIQLNEIYMATIDTEYANTDFDLKSEAPFDALHQELSLRCLVLHYERGDDDHYRASYESDHDGESKDCAARDILLIVDAINALSEVAKTQFETCYLREFNIGFHCGDTFGFVHSIPDHAINAVSSARCSLGVTLYPARKPDGTPQM